MIISLTYETTVTAMVDIDTGTVVSINALKVLGSASSGLHGYTHVEGVQPSQISPYESPPEPFRREQVKKAVEILRVSPHPEWGWKEPQ